MGIFIFVNLSACSFHYIYIEAKGAILSTQAFEYTNLQGRE